MQNLIKFAKEIQSEILTEIKEKAPNAEIYWTTLYNPFYGTKLNIRALFPELEKLNLDSAVLDGLQTIDLGDIVIYIAL